MAYHFNPDVDFIIDIREQAWSVSRSEKGQPVPSYKTRRFFGMPILPSDVCLGYRYGTRGILAPFEQIWLAAISRTPAALSRASAAISRASAALSRASAALSRASAALSRAPATHSRTPVGLSHTPAVLSCAPAELGRTPAELSHTPAIRKAWKSCDWNRLRVKKSTQCALSNLKSFRY